MLEAYRTHVTERAIQGIPPEPLSAEQTADLVELLKNPPTDEESTLIDFCYAIVCLLELTKPPT